MKSESVAWEETDCNLCGSQSRAKFLDAEGRYGGLGQLMTLVKCLGCGLVYLNPRPTQEAIGNFYGPEYYAHSGLDLRRKSLKARMRNRFLDGLGGYGSSFDHKLLHRLAPIGSVDVILPSSRRGKLLDVGCGDGERADWYRDRGFDVYGVELSETGAANAGKIGIEVHHGTLSSAKYPSDFFDSLIMAHVLEHTHSPREYLAEALRVLKPGGMLAVAVPNIESHSAHIFNSDWAFLMLPIHLYHFSVVTLTAYLHDLGFSIDLLTGKTVYPAMVKNSCRLMRKHKPLGTSLKAWLGSGIIPSSVAQLRSGVTQCDAITAYGVKPA